MDKKYTGTVYIASVGSELDYAVCRDSVDRIIRTQGDSPTNYMRGTKGYETRQMHIDRFLATEHSFILMLDADMLFEPNTLTKLRAHGLAYVTGAYMRRQYKPVMAPVWFEYNESGDWPHVPATSIPTEMTRVGASGWGCILIHRDVILAVRDILKGENEVLEDDMDIWPYDLDKIMHSLNYISMLAEKRQLLPSHGEQLKKYTDILRQEIRPLRAEKGPVGSDIRFPFFAREAGFDLWLDPAVMPGHVIHYPLIHSDFDAAGDEYVQKLADTNLERVASARTRWLDRLAELKELGVG